MSSNDPYEAVNDALREAAALERVPDDVVAAARATFTWRTIDAELAALAFDSIDAGELVGARGDSGVRSLSFEYGALAIELEVSTATRGPVTIQGQVAPGEPATIEVQHADHAAPFSAQLRSNGRFEATGVPAGSIRLMVRFAPGDGPAMLLTEWVTL
jgi:hypothetical protein